MIDDIDRKLIYELQSQKRLRYSAVAKKLQISRSTISRRINRMLRENIIRMIGVPNITAIGYKGIALIAINMEVNKIENACKKLEIYDAVHLVAVAFGRYDILISVYFPSIDLLTEFIKKELSNIEGIIKVETFYIAELRKLTFGWLSGGTQSRITKAKGSKQ